MAVVKASADRFGHRFERQLFVDTSAWFAFVNRKDPDHHTVARLLERYEGRLLTSNFVFDETITLCLVRLGHEVARQVGEALLDPGLTDLVRVQSQDEAAAWQLFEARPDKRYSFTDCTSFVLLRRLGKPAVAALDDHFRQEGFEVEVG
ncbi:MAG TPA: PIN domain-containing protein [Thermoanaerobaculia bacterium]|nr:PIN domain-containing protein [Thermoanaerobaculia bacterium]